MAGEAAQALPQLPDKAHPRGTPIANTEEAGSGAMERHMKKCSILIINTAARKVPERQALVRMGFVVNETREWPEHGTLLAHEVVIVLISRIEGAAMLAARIRAKPHFGNRVLIGVVPATASPSQRRCAVGAGFDDVLGEQCEPRSLVARILRPLRERGELRCGLPPLAA